MSNPGGMRGDVGLIGAAAVFLGIASFGAYLSYKQRASGPPQPAQQQQQDPSYRPAGTHAETPSENDSDPYANHPLLQHVNRIIVLLSDRESGDRACSRALDVILQLTNTEDGRILLSRQGILSILVELLYRSVATPNPPADGSSSSSSTSQTPAVSSLSQDLHDVVSKAIWSISNLSLDLANQQLLKKIQAFPLLVRFLADDMDDEIKLRSLQALLNLSVFENLNEDALRSEGLLEKLPELLVRSKNDNIRWLCLKVLRNLVVSNELNARTLLQSNIIPTCLGLLGECDILSQRSLELIYSLLPTQVTLPPLSAAEVTKLFQLLDVETSLSDSLYHLASKIVPLIIPHLDRSALAMLEQRTRLKK